MGSSGDLPIDTRSEQLEGRDQPGARRELVSRAHIACDLRMVVRRHLGVTWAAVHGPAAPRDLAVWILDLGFSGLVVGPAPRPVDWSGLRALRSDLPFAFAAVRVAGPREVDDRADAGLASRHEGERAAALASVGQAVETARRLGVDRIVLEPSCRDGGA